MTEFFNSLAGWTIGCDPGPKYSAFALVRTDGLEVAALSYAPNYELANVESWGEFMDCLAAVSADDGWRRVLKPKDVAVALEKCAPRFGLTGNNLLFETCMAAGVVRAIATRAVRPDRCVGFSPSDWRYVLCGKGGAKDTNVREILLTLAPHCDKLVRQCSKECKSRMKLTKPITSHLRDAIGVALATGFVNYRTGKSAEYFPMWTEVNCG